MLSHTSGIPDIVDEEESVLISANAEEAWKKVLALPIDFKPGEKFSYNQTNYLLLGRIIDKLSGMPFTEFIIKEQLVKAGMPEYNKSGFWGNKRHYSTCCRRLSYSKGKTHQYVLLISAFFANSCGNEFNSQRNCRLDNCFTKQQLLKQKSSLGFALDSCHIK